MKKETNNNEYNKKQLILCILISIILIFVVLTLMNKNKTKQKANAPALDITTESKTALSEEEQQTITTYDDYEIVNHVVISNQKAFDIYKPPINLTGNLANFLWLWLKYYTGDSQTQWHATIDGTSYLESEDIITFNLSIDEFPNETVECIYYSNYSYFDFYNKFIMQQETNSKKTEEE